MKVGIMKEIKENIDAKEKNSSKSKKTVVENMIKRKVDEHNLKYNYLECI